MKINLVLNVMDPRFVDPEHHAGVSEEGYEALVRALVEVGFEIVEGPDVVQETEDAR